MNNKQLPYFFLSSFVTLFVGMGLFPLLPLYAADFGATRTVIGVYYAVIYVASLSGVLLTGWLAERLPRRGLFITASALGIPALALLGQATALWQIVVLTAALWFLGAVEMTVISVLLAVSVDSNSRGKSFSLMYLAPPLGALVGGTVVGRLVAWQGYPFMFTILAVVWAALPAIGLLKLQDVPPARVGTEKNQGSARMDGTFYLLMLVSLLLGTAVNASRLGTSLSMQALDFSAGAVASTATLSGLVTIPVILLAGALSDRLGRKAFLTMAYVLAAAGALILVTATQLWQFWLAAMLVMIAWSVNGAVASAFAADLLSAEALGRGLPRLNAMDSVASIVSFAGAGVVMDVLGAPVLYLAAAVLAVLALMQLRQLQPGAQGAVVARPAVVQGQPAAAGC